MSLIDNGKLVIFKEHRDDEEEQLVIINSWSDTLQKYSVTSCNNPTNKFYATSDQLNDDGLPLNKLLKLGIEQISRHGTFIPEECQLTDRNIIAIFKTSALIRIADALEDINDSLNSINELIIKNQKQ